MITRARKMHQFRGRMYSQQFIQISFEQSIRQHRQRTLPPSRPDQLWKTKRDILQLICKYLILPGPRIKLERTAIKINAECLSARSFKYAPSNQTWTGFNYTLLAPPTPRWFPQAALLQHSNSYSSVNWSHYTRTPHVLVVSYILRRASVWALIPRLVSSKFVTKHLN
jgi:hypothetical protein